ncbi:MAG: bifunctional riboflavin kinase/FAD synthetase [Alphaproteobacteria bacterium]|nr:MAG: bifunctional riboflavin kinase/FAD synthetase [Alphaproteobacteria bacterium]
MRILRHPAEITPPYRGGVVVLGNFDGLHRGHQVVIGEAGRLARAMNAPFTVFVTEPHPRQFFQPGAPPFRLTPFRDRVRLMQGFSPDLLLALPFDQELAATHHADFVRGILLDHLGARHLVVGFDYRFGQARGGSVETLAWMGAMEGFGLTVVPPVRFGIEGAAGEVYSSSLVRAALKEGKARRAAALLGHWWSVSGHVIAGDRRGRELGFPTVNILLPSESIRPRHGVYAVRLLIEEAHGSGDESAVFEGVANFGRRPTVATAGELLEVHLFDFNGDLYGRHVRVEFVGFIRPERRFEGLEALKSQIVEDATAARLLLADPENRRDHLPPLTLEGYLCEHPEPPVQLIHHDG